MSVCSRSGDVSCRSIHLDGRKYRSSAKRVLVSCWPSCGFVTSRVRHLLDFVFRRKHYFRGPIRLQVFDRCRGIDNDPVEPDPMPSRVSSQLSLVPLITPARFLGRPGEVRLSIDIYTSVLPADIKADIKVPGAMPAPCE